MIIFYEGYDYSILDEQYHLLDGGVYDNPDITIQRAMDMVIADLKEPRFSAVTEQYYRDEFLQGEVYAGSEAEIVDFEELSEKAEEVEQADLEAKQAEFKENNPDVIADFRAKTAELFHSLDGQSADDIDTFEYRDSVPDREAQVQMIANDIRSGNVKPLQIFLQTSIDEGIDEDSERQAKELIAKLAEYKPLAKIEELEEQNYNMIDDRLNNGVEKFNREEEKKEQVEKPQARTSLKERLAAKQTEVAQGKKDSKEQEKAKKTNREEI